MKGKTEDDPTSLSENEEQQNQSYSEEEQEKKISPKNQNVQ
jgi:hypothetical protein